MKMPLNFKCSYLGAPSEQEDSDKEIMEKLQAQIDAEKEKNKEEENDEGLFQVTTLNKQL